MTKSPVARRLALAMATALVLGPALAACTNTIEGLEKDSRKVFGTEGGSPSTGQNPSASNAKTGTWKNPE
ncbi:MAG: hypothetical protein RLO51_23075 [Thalassobaculum sp.]|uniref:hypothetical protein n=1 Tax=Thalassobaculum sp. TaxID=2022740 RepID=UPI0032EE2702